MKIFFDMDGVLAKFYEDKHYLIKMLCKNYFRNLNPYEQMLDVVGKLMQENDVYILSSCIPTPYCKREKLEWLNQYLPQINQEHIILVNQGQSKRERIEHLGLINDICVLIDDYSKNIYEWSNGGNDFVSIKWVNEINDRTNKHYDRKACNYEELLNILREI